MLNLLFMERLLVLSLINAQVFPGVGSPGALTSIYSAISTDQQANGHVAGNPLHHQYVGSHSDLATQLGTRTECSRGHATTNTCNRSTQHNSFSKNDDMFITMYINKHSALSLLLQKERNKEYRHNSHQTKYHINLTGMVIEPSLTSSILSCGCDPSIVHPTDWHVPRISFTVPERYLDMDRGRIVRAMSITWSIVILPLCLTVRQKKTVSHPSTTKRN